MTFNSSGTQSGTDTSWSGLSSTTGVTVLSIGDRNLYYAPTVVITITGTLTIADPAKETVICSRMVIANGGTYTGGTFATDGVTPLTGGQHFTAMGYTAQVADSVGTGAIESQNGSTLTLIGGGVTLSGAWRIADTATVNCYSLSVSSTKAIGALSNRIRAYGSSVLLRNCQLYDFAYDLFKMPTQTPSVKGFGAEYVFQYVGSVFGGADAKFTASALSNTDGVYDFDNYGNGWIELFNCAKGANLNVVDTLTSNAGPDNTGPANHVVPLFQDVNFTVTNLAGTVQQNARFRCVDSPVSNSPTATIATRSNLKTWDFRNPITYTGTTNSSGQVSASPCLQVWWGASNLKNLRFPSSIATFRFCAYALKQQDFNITLGSDTAINYLAAMSTVTGLTITESAAAALTGLALVASGATGGTLTISGTRVILDCWHYYRQWIATLANFGSNDTWDYDPALLDIAGWSVSISGSFSGNIKSLVSTTITGTITTSGSQFGGTITSNKSLALTGCTFASGTTINNSTGTSITITVDSAQLPNITTGANVIVQSPPTAFTASALTSPTFTNVRCRLSLVVGGPVIIDESTSGRLSGGIAFVNTDVNITTDKITLAGIAGKINANTVIRFYYATGEANGLPGGIDVRAVYYPVMSSLSGNSVSVTGTIGGAAINLTSTGSGAMYADVWTEFDNSLITSGSYTVNLNAAATAKSVTLANGDVLTLQAIHWRGNPSGQTPCIASEYLEKTFVYAGVSLSTLETLQISSLHNQFCVIQGRDGSQVTTYAMDNANPMLPGRIRVPSATAISSYDAVLLAFYLQSTEAGMRVLRGNVHILGLNSIKFVGQVTISTTNAAILTGPYTVRADKQSLIAPESNRIDMQWEGTVGVPVRVEVPIDLPQNIVDTLAAILALSSSSSSGGGGGLDAAGVRSAIGIDGPNLDTKLSNLQNQNARID
jgi:hypothetical protein